MGRAVGDPSAVIDPVDRRLLGVGGAIRGGARRGGPAEPQVPLADPRGVIPRITEQRGDRRPVRLDQRVAVAPQHAPRQPRAPGVPPGEQAVAGRRAHRRRRMSVGQPQALPRQPIEMRCGDPPGRVERADIAVAEIVGQDQDDVGPGLGSAIGGPTHGKQHGGKESAHPRILHRSRGAINDPGAARGD